MSLKSILSKIWETIKNLFADISPDLKSAIHLGVVITENIKLFVDSPAADVLTIIIPGTIDDGIKSILRAKIPAILTTLKLVDNCDDLTDPNQLVACAITTLQSLEGEINSAYLHTLSILIAQAAADGELTWSDSVYLLEWYYQHKYKV
ncbi:hypothetical protein [Mucilaginibacter antarcticus]|uniref:Uncharacterized protein n=1 Tax=Mucilaginibacter antarcticus TaxID=1855725 RepID=A0ABW5XT44_9SPHI